MLTTRQIRLIEEARMQGKTQVQAAAVADVSERTVRSYESGGAPTKMTQRRTYRTREDPFDAVWDEVCVPLLQSDTKRKLTATGLLRYLQGREEGGTELYPDDKLRTLQRRMRQWRAMHGSALDVVFDQDHPPGREAAFDFTVCDELEITIGRQAFPHLLFTLTLSCSKLRSVSPAFGETFEAVVSGLQNALWEFGGVPEVIRHDNMSAATQELRKGGGRTLTRRFREVTDHLGVKSTRIRPGKSQENGMAERTNGVLKAALAEALVLRGHREFTSVASYMELVQSVVSEQNARRGDRADADLAALQPLPDRRFPEYTEYRPRVRRTSTVRVAGRTYSVPSRLIGHEVMVRQHADHLEVYLGGELTEMMLRLRGSRDAQIDYRHVVDSLSRKPGAFERYKHREQFFPTPAFRRAYDLLTGWRPTRANAEYLRILKLAAHGSEPLVADALQLLVEEGELFGPDDVRQLVAPSPSAPPAVRIDEPNLAQYDNLLMGAF